MPGLWSDIKIPPMCKRMRADLEEQAGRKFLSDEQAQAYYRRQLNSWVDPRSVVRVPLKKRKAVGKA
jgi:hypothetical protein